VPNQTTPTRNSVTDALHLSALLRADWDERLERIPAWHPRNEVDPAAAAAAAIDWESDDNPFKKRFQDTQASYTTNQQELARLKRLEEDPQAYLELGKGKGWVEVDETQAPPAGGQADETLAQYQQRLEAAEARLEAHDARIASENAAAGEELFHQDLDTWAETEGVKLSKADHNAIFGLLMKAPDPTQEATARQIFDAHVADKKAERETWETEYAEARKRPRVPHVPGGGSAETGVAPDYEGMTRAQIDREMAERVRAANQR